MTPDPIGETGYTLDELAAYHDRGRTPPIAEIDADAHCSAVLDSMDRLGALSRELVESDAPTDISESWLHHVLSEIALESRAGSDLLLADDGDVRIVVTEGALRGLVRDAGDDIDGVLVERVWIGAEDERVDVRMTISAIHGAPLPALASRVRHAVREALTAHTGWTVGDVDVTVDALRDREDER